MATITGTSGNDTLNGTSGADTIWAQGGNDVVDGAGGNDTVGGGAGNDQLDGGGGNDTVFGGAGADTVEGGAGADIVFGGSGNDVFIGGSGNDTLVGGAGNDVLRSGSGADVFQFYDNHGDDVITTGDFDVSSGDIIQLGGSISSYTLSPSGLSAGLDGILGTADDEYLFVNVNTGQGTIALQTNGYPIAAFQTIANHFDSAIELI